MPLETIVRSRGGTAQRVVHIRDIVVPEVPEVQQVLFNQNWLLSAKALQTDLAILAGELCAGHAPSRDLFVPNYWKDLRALPRVQRELLEELWHLAHDLGKEILIYDHNRWRVVKDGVPGMIYWVKSQAAILDNP